MAYFPKPIAHVWDDLVVGGSSGTPRMFLLEEDNLIDNGYFQDTIVEWDGGMTRAAVAFATKGSYVMSIATAQYAHLSMARTEDNILFTGFTRFTGGTGDSVVDILVYPSNAPERWRNPSEFYQLRIQSTTGFPKDTWCPFYIALNDNAWSSFTYLHFEFRVSGTGATCYVDDLRAHHINSYLELDNPQTLNLTWQRLIDAEYEMEDKSLKSYPKGWRPNISIGYEYCSVEQLVRNIDISENEFMFFVPQNDGLMGIYTRMVNDFSSAYFKDRFIGHQNEIELTSIYPWRYKNRQFGHDYFYVQTEVSSESASTSQSSSASASYSGSRSPSASASRSASRSSSVSTSPSRSNSASKSPSSSNSASTSQSRSTSQSASTSPSSSRSGSSSVSPSRSQSASGSMSTSPSRSESASNSMSTSPSSSTSPSRSESASTSQSSSPSPSSPP